MTKPYRTQSLTAYSHRPIAFMARYIALRPLLHTIVLASVLSAVGCALGSQYALKNLVDIISRGDAGLLWHAFVILIGLIVADNLSWRVGGWAASHVFVAVSGDVRRDLFGHVSQHSPAYFADRLPGMLAGRISATSNALFTTETSLAWNVLPPCIAVIGAIFVLGTVNLVMAGSLIAVAALLILAIYKLAKRGTPLHRQYATNAAVVDGELVDVISNMNAVRLFGATMLEQNRLSAKIDAELAARGRSLRYLELLRIFHGIVTAVLTAALLGWALLLWSEGRASPGDIVLVSTLGFVILHGTRDLAVALVDLTQHVARLSEAVATLLVPHTLSDAANARPLVLPHGRGATIEFNDVHFAYPKRLPLLSDFNLRIEPGERVGLVGRSGAGKSTVLLLLQRFYDAQAGRVAINNKDIRELKQDSLRRAIAVVPQDVSLFHRSIRENIRYGRPDASDAEIVAAAEAARCRSFIEAMPEGFDTIVGERGIKLSGGQRQRLAIARAFLKDAPILVLDEATSSLDSESEAAIQNALDRLMRGRSVIAVAHRLSTLQRFDRIVVLDSGRIIDEGSPKDLARRPGPYRDLLERQLGQRQVA
ncbi:MAG TPA: ABC transporter ATP-binding protein [Ferrovibrio sp.]|uniref:ABC transporter ATP-binding protein n=1 Tax=Ferrovibrio sp. TaxID=1917215 RepID=UPI002ED08BBA